MSAGQALNDMAWQAVIAALTFASVYMLVRYAWYDLGVMLRYQERRYDRVLNHQLLLDIPPRIALAVSGALILLLGLTLGWMVNSFLFFLVGCAIGFFIPNVLIRHMEQKRAAKLETQLVDGITTLSSSVRAGLNLIQAMEVLERNSSAPLKQEIAQMLREYQMGLDFNQCMRNACFSRRWKCTASAAAIPASRWIASRKASARSIGWRASSTH
jgi:Flp pilus assembly protein TadB